jgi:hypothetical protein
VAEARDCLAAKACDKDVGGLSKQKASLGSSLVQEPKRTC